MIRLKLIKNIANGEWRFIRRNKVALLTIIMLITLTVIAISSAAEYQRIINEQRLNYQSQANHEFEAQPDRHPHRVAHFGHFLFRPLDPLTAFDNGIDTYTGHTIFLEAHRQNSANFSDVRQSSLLVRFGQLSPAFILQVLIPLLLVFIGHAIISRERHSGTLALLFSQGVSAQTFILGKLITLSGIAVISLLPAAIGLIWIGISQSTSALLVSLILLAYLIWLMIWVVLVVLASALFNNSRDALLVLLMIWCLSIIVIPRIAPDIVNKHIPLQTSMETNIAVEREITQIGDSHNPNDPYFSNFKQRILDQYGVSRIEDLPVNYRGLVMAESERMTSQLFNQYVEEINHQQQLQNNYTDRFGWISPIIALRRLSMQAAASDLKNYQNFLKEAENYRYKMMQYLNHLQTEELSFADDSDESKYNRINRQNWKNFPPFDFQPISASQRITEMKMPFLILFSWFLLLTILIVPVSILIQRNIK